VSLAEKGHVITVIDQRSHVAGNCHTQRDDETGIMLHVYGLSFIPIIKKYGIMLTNMVNLNLL
jgi:UDP-galactopyranose mutase